MHLIRYAGARNYCARMILEALRFKTTASIAYAQGVLDGLMEMDGVRNGRQFIRLSTILNLAYPSRKERI